MEERGKVDLSSNWNTLGDVDLKSILINSLHSSDIEIEDLGIDTCVCLIQNENADKSKAELDIKTNGFITDIVLLSEAQVIEVFGVNDEYLLTNSGKFFDDWEEMAVYYSKISLPNIPICKLKFTRSKCENRLWIYGLKVVVQNGNEDLKNPVQFNLEHIQRLLGNSSVGSGNNFRNLMQLFLENFPRNNLNNALGKTAGRTDYTNHRTDIVCHENNRDNFLEHVFSKLNVNCSGSSESNEINAEEGERESGSNLILAYIDKKCHEIKSDILHEVDMKLNRLREETNCKLDKIISLLENDGIKIKT